MIYTRVKFSRGTGLGNRLWPWSRCKIFTKEHQATMLAPQWTHMRTATFRKGGINYANFLRKVLLYDNFINADEITGLRKLSIRLSKESTTEDTIVYDNKIITFEGYKNFFGDILAHKKYIKSELHQISSPKWIKKLQEIQDFDIGINIRMGNDFTNKTSLKWFKKAEEILLNVFPHAKSIIITDGKFADLKDTFNFKKTEFIDAETAILDLLILSKSKIILGSAGSSFTAWGSFLSGAPTLIEPGNPMNYFNLYNVPHGPTLLEYQIEDLPNIPFENLYKAMNKTTI